MSGPTWLSRALAALMVAVALYHAARLVVPRMRPSRRDVDLTHLAMGVVMALMLIASLSSRWMLGWALAFAVPAVWFTWQSMYVYVFDGVRGVWAHLPHALACATMVYLLVPVPGAGAASMPGMSVPSRATVFAVPLLIVMCGVVALNVAALNAEQARRQTAARRRNPGLADGCRLAMSSTMVYMLVMVL